MEGCKYHKEFNVWVHPEGRVYRNDKEMHQNIGHWGYRRVHCVSGRTTYVHTLVADLFCEGYQPGFVVNHINNDISDNRAENLEWLSRSENSSKPKVRGAKSTGPHLEKAKVIINMLADEWDEMKATAKKAGYGTGSAWVREVLRREVKVLKNITESLDGV